MKTQLVLFTLIGLLATCVTVPSTTHAQDFETIERRLGGIVSDGELTLEQASVMMHALRDFSRNREREKSSHLRNAEQPMDRQVAELLEHYERLGIDEESVDRVQHALQENDIHGEQLHRSMPVILRLVQMMRSSDKAFEMPESMEKYFREELELSGKQSDLIVGMAKRLSRQSRSDASGRGNSDEIRTKILEWIESLGDELKAAVEKGELSEENAWKKWEWIKGNRIGPKTEAAVEQGDLSREQVEEIWKSIEEGETDWRESKADGSQ